MADVRARKPAKKAKADKPKPKDADEEIPNTRPWFLWATPVLCVALLAYLALTTSTRISLADYARLWGRAPASNWTEPFAVRELPGRGKGLVATRAIARGELITRERPLVHGVPLESAPPPARARAPALTAPQPRTTRPRCSRPPRTHSTRPRRRRTTRSPTRGSRPSAPSRTPSRRASRSRSSRRTRSRPARAGSACSRAWRA
jgi:hypothetical protein